MARIHTTAVEGKANKQLPDRLDAIMKRLELPTRADLAYQVEARSVGSYFRWYQNPPSGFPRYRFLYRFAKLGVNLNFLVFGEKPVMRSDALPIEASIALVRQEVIDRIRKERNLSKQDEASLPSGEGFVKFMVETVRKSLLTN
jgi:hypothetical protein